jgi:hypothetical protein
MNPDNNDPKNHAPPVSPGDAWGDIWGDLDYAPSSEQTELPQKIKEWEIPKKRGFHHQYTRRCAPHFDKRSDGWDASNEPLAGGGPSAREADHKAVKRQPKRLVSSLARSLAIVPLKKPPALIAKITGDADSAGNLGLCEAEMLSPGGHGRDATLEGQVHDLVRHGAVREPALHAAELLVGHDHKCRLAVLADDDLKLSTCVHRAS